MKQTAPITVIDGPPRQESGGWYFFWRGSHCGPFETREQAELAMRVEVVTDLYAAYRFLEDHPNSGSQDRWRAARERGRDWETGPYLKEAREWVRAMRLFPEAAR